jgi:hypothetical protein
MTELQSSYNIFHLPVNELMKFFKLANHLHSIKNNLKFQFGFVFLIQISMSVLSAEMFVKMLAARTSPVDSDASVIQVTSFLMMSQLVLVSYHYIIVRHRICFDSHFLFSKCYSLRCLHLFNNFLCSAGSLCATNYSFSHILCK